MEQYTPEQKEFIKQFCDKSRETWDVTCKKLKPVFQKKFNDILNVQSWNSLQKLYSRLQAVSDDMKEDIKAVIQQDISRDKTKKELDTEKKKNKQLIVELSQIREDRDVFAGIRQDKYTKTEIKPNPEKKSEAVAVMVGSDWHSEEVVDPESVNHMNEYSPKIAQQRIQNFFRNGLKLTDMMAKEVSIEKILLAMLWDFISGYIHPELIENNAMSPTRAISFVKKQICDGIHYLLDNSKYDLLIVMKPGNHGRTTEKKRISTASENSYEFMMYNFIADEFEWNPRVKFIIEKSYHTYVKIFDKTIRFHHGEALKFGGGIWGITIPVRKAISQWNKVKHADLDCFWHFHQLTDNKDFICNGSIVWFNAFAIEIKADYEEPQQAFFLMDRDHGKTIVAPIFVN